MENLGFQPDTTSQSDNTNTQKNNSNVKLTTKFKNQPIPENVNIISSNNIVVNNMEDVGVIVSQDTNNNVVGLQRKVGLFSAISLIVGTIIGSGIFIAPGGLLRETHSVGLALVIWTVCGILSTLCGIIYIELGAIVPRSGGEYAYLMEAFGEIPAFLFAWISTILLKPSGIAVTGLAFAKYCVGPFITIESNENECKTLVWPMVLISAAVISSITVINSISVSLATKVQNIFTIAKLVALSVIVIGGFYNIVIMGKTEHMSHGFVDSNWNYGAIASAFYSGLWAYDGWNNLNYITEEIKNPSRNLPLAILIGLPLVTVFYIFVNISYLTIISPEEIMDKNNSVGILFGDRMLGVFAFVMPLAVAFSTFGSVNGSQFTAGRLCYVASREGHLIQVLSFVDMKRNTPSPAMIFNAAVAILMAVVLDIEGLIDFFSFTAWIFYGAAIAALIRLRYTKPHAPRPFKIPIVVVYFVLCIAIYLVIAPIIQKPKIEFLYSIGFILFGLVLYVPFVHYGFVLPGMRTLTLTTQKLLQVIPPENINLPPPPDTKRCNKIK